MVVSIFVPSGYGAKGSVRVVDIKDLSVDGNYDGQYLQWTKFSDALPAIANKARTRRDTSVGKSKFNLDELPKERTINFFCDDDGYERNLCVNSVASVKNFRRGNEPIVVTLNFTLTIEVFGKIS